MIQFDRQKSILELLRARKSATVRELAEAVFSSEASVRRDLETLETQGYVKRVYGGAVLAQTFHEVTPIALRDGDHAAAKNEVAEKAAELVSDGCTLILDGSSTTRRMLKHLVHRRGLRIFTNNLRVFKEMEQTDARVYCTGGLYNSQNHDFVGPAAERFLEGISADMLFFSSQGISEEGEITDVSEEETSLRRVMLSRAKQKIFLCDDSKIGIHRDFLLCTKADVDKIICNVKLPWE